MEMSIRMQYLTLPPAAPVFATQPHYIVEVAADGQVTWEQIEV
jgi:hypothetical protein